METPSEELLCTLVLEGDREVWKTSSACLYRGVYWWLFGSVRGCKQLIGGTSGPLTVLSELVLTDCFFGYGGELRAQVAH